MSTILTDVIYPLEFAIVNLDTGFYFNERDGIGYPVWVKEVVYAKKYDSSKTSLLASDLQALRGMGYRVSHTNAGFGWR